MYLIERVCIFCNNFKCAKSGAERKKDTHELLAEIVLRDLQAEQDEGLGALDDDDKENDEIEYEAWKVRCYIYI